MPSTGFRYIILSNITSLSLSVKGLAVIYKVKLKVFLSFYSFHVIVLNHSERVLGGTLHILIYIYKWFNNKKLFFSLYAQLKTLHYWHIFYEDQIEWNLFCWLSFSSFFSFLFFSYKKNLYFSSRVEMNGKQQQTAKRAPSHHQKRQSDTDPAYI